MTGKVQPSRLELTRERQAVRRTYGQEDMPSSLTLQAGGVHQGRQAGLVCVCVGGVVGDTWWGAQGVLCSGTRSERPLLPQQLLASSFS